MEYLLRDDQPASTTLYTASDDMARKKSSPTLRSATTQPSATGTTMKESSAVISTRDGATTNTRLSANGGTQSSLNRILNVSASTWSRPAGPTRLGP